MWLCEQSEFPLPPWLQELAGKFPADMGCVEIGEPVTMVPRRKHRRIVGILGRPSEKSDYRHEAERDLRQRGANLEMTQWEYAGHLKDRIDPDSNTPKIDTIVTYIADAPNLWRKYVIEPRKRRRQRR